jgi:RNA polymerase sigma factor (sigma-70 family)
VRSSGEPSDAELAALACDGQRAAAGELLSRHLHLLTVMARRLAIPSLDADDLLAEAIANLLAKWADGDGPKEHVEAYIIRSMRNRVADELRSPRSKVVALDLEPEPSRAEDHEHHRAEMYREFELVQKALGRLPEDQRKVLLATVVDGRKPGDLVEEFARPAGAIYSLSRRAKVGLRRALLQTILVEDAPDACVQSAADLPQTITPDLLDEADSAETQHLRDCARCSAAWSRYLGLIAHTGASSLLVVGCAALPPAPLPVPVVPAPPTAAPSGDGHSGQESTTRTVTVGTRRVRPLHLGTGLSAAALGLTLVAIGMTSEATLMTVGIIPKPVSQLNVIARSGAEHSIEVHFSVDRSWTVQRLTMSVPPALELAHAPDEWTCTGSAGTITCRTAGSSPTGGLFRFSGTAASGSRGYTLVIEATAGPAAIVAKADGQLPS